MQAKLNCLHPTLFPLLHDPSARSSEEGNGGGGNGPASALAIPNTFVPRHTAPLSSAGAAAQAEAAAAASAVAAARTPGEDVSMSDAEAGPSCSGAGKLLLAPNCLRWAQQP
jgi:hypothetical protein